jgi:hypothetical protein
MVGFKLSVRPEPLRNLFGNLEVRMSTTLFHTRHCQPYVVLRMRVAEGGFAKERPKRGGMVGGTYQGFRFLDMLMTKEELAIEVAQINRIEIDDMDFAKPV